MPPARILLPVPHRAGRADVKALRILFWLIVIAGLAAGAAWLADNPGIIVLDWGSYRIETSAAITVVLFALVLLVLVVIGRTVRWILQGSPAVREGRRRRGYQALTRGLVAVAAGDGGDATRLAKRANSLIKEDQPLLLVLKAQAAQLKGDDQAAHNFFTRMLDQPDTEFLGLRGLIVEATRNGNAREALGLARRAEALRPGAPWVLGTLFELETRQGLWQDAQKTLERSARKRLVPPPDAKRRKALLWYQRAREELMAGNEAAALDWALRASGYAHDFIPAAVLATQLVAPTRPRKAARIVERAWRSSPHPDLAEAYASIYPEELPARRVKRIVRLSGMNPAHPESRLAVATQAVKAGLWGVARSNLAPLVEHGAPSPRACRLMARCERDGNGDSVAAQQWEDRAGQATEPQDWRCLNCARDSHDWTPVCAGCDGFDTLRWPSAAAKLEPEPAWAING